MDFLTILTEVSKLAVLAFTITVAVIGFEIYRVIAKRAKPKVTVEEFDKDKKRTLKEVTVSQSSQTEKSSKQFDHKKNYILFAVIGLLALGFTGILFFSQRIEKNKLKTKTEAVVLVEQPTLKPTIFDQLTVVTPPLSTPTFVTMATTTPTVISTSPTQMLPATPINTIVSVTPTIASLPKTGIIEGPVIIFGLSFALIAFALAF